MKPQYFRIKKLLRRVILAAGLILVAIAIGRFSLNYSGYCFEEHRFLSNEEKISIAIRDVFGTYPPNLIEYGENLGEVIVIGGHTPAHPIYYKDIDTFRAENTDCCRLTQRMERTKSKFPIQLGSRLSGDANTFVEVIYKLKYIDESGVERSQIHIEYVAISNCGHAWSGI